LQVSMGGPPLQSCSEFERLESARARLALT
jgi:hypothetical protein